MSAVLVRRYLIESIGWVGAVLSLSAYSLNSLNLISSQSLEYLVMNMMGCCFLIIYAIHKKAHASWVLNSIWLLMTAAALVRIFLFS